MILRSGFASRNPQAFGFAVTLLGVMFFFPDALVVRLIGGDTMTIAVWRGLGAGSVTLLGIALFARSSLPTWRELISWPSLLMILLQGLGSIFFLASLGNTTVANSLFILATAPFITALLSWLVLKERVDTPTWAAILTVFAGVAVIGSGSFGAGGTSSGGVSAHLTGDFYALGNACTIAAYYVVIRLQPDRNHLVPIALGYLLTSVIALPFANMVPYTARQSLLVAISGCVILAGAVALLQLGPRYLPAPEVAMITMLEIIAGPLLVWVFLGENPGRRTLIGGAVIVTAIAAHSVYRLRNSARSVLQSPS